MPPNSCFTLHHFNSQPREGGWQGYAQSWQDADKFQLTAARRRLAGVCCTAPVSWLFQLTAARRRLADCVTLPSALRVFQLTAARRRLANSL